LIPMDPIQCTSMYHKKEPQETQSTAVISGNLCTHVHMYGGESGW